MHTRDIIRRQQEDIQLLIEEKAAVEARVKQLENENEFLLKRIRELTN